MNAELLITNCMCCMGSDSLIFLSVFIAELQLLLLEKPDMRLKALFLFCTFALVTFSFTPALGQEGGAGGCEFDKSK